MFRTRSAARVGAAVLVVALLGASGAFAKAAKGQLAPDFTGTTLEGRKVVLSEFRGKNPVVLCFFAQFGTPCRKEFPRLKELDEKLGPKGLRVVSVSMDEDRAAAGAIPKEAGSRFPVVFDPKGEIAARYGVQAIPHTLVIDKSGKLQAEIIGLDLDLLDRSVEQVMK